MTKIYYFSGTGNTLWSAKKIAAILGDGGEECSLFNFGSEMKTDTTQEIIVQAEKIVFLFPVYAYGLPKIVRHFIEKAVIHAPYIAVLATYGTSPGGALAEFERILRKKKIKGNFYGRIPSVENYIPIFGPPTAKILEKKLPEQKEATENAALCIKELQTNKIFTFRPLSFFVSSLFSIAKAFFYRMYNLNASCNGCGICEKLCPVHAIVMRAGTPLFTEGCEHCQACLNWCPQRAINFIGRLRSDTPRYHHPEITIKDML